MDQQFYLITDLLPIMDEVACFSSVHHVGPLVFENGDNRLRIGALVVILPIGNRPEKPAHAVEFVVHLVP